MKSYQSMTSKHFLSVWRPSPRVFSLVYYLSGFWVPPLVLAKCFKILLNLAEQNIRIEARMSPLQTKIYQKAIFELVFTKHMGFRLSLQNSSRSEDQKEIKKEEKLDLVKRNFFQHFDPIFALKKFHSNSQGCFSFFRKIVNWWDWLNENIYDKAVF